MRARQRRIDVGGRVELDRVRLKVALAERQLTQGQLAQRLNIAPSTLSGWVNGYATPPRNWVGRVEQALGLPGGALRPTTRKQVAD